MYLITLVINATKLCMCYSIIFLISHLHLIGAQIGDNERAHNIKAHA